MSGSGNVGVVALLECGSSYSKKASSYAMKVTLAQMLQGGVIVNVNNPKQARIKEEVGAVAVTTAGPLGDVVNRMIDLGLVRWINKSVSIPVISHALIEHFVEAQILEAVGAAIVRTARNRSNNVAEAIRNLQVKRLRGQEGDQSVDR